MTSSSLFLIAGALLVALIVGGVIRQVLHGRRGNKDADHDVVTGAPNRRRLDGDIAGRDGTSPTSVLMVEIDRFPAFSKWAGTPTANSVLGKLAKALEGGVRGDDVMYRYEGAQFCVLLDWCEEDTAHVVADRLQEAVAQAQSGMNNQLTISIGVACGPDHSIKRSMQRADDALFAAKSSGGGQVVVAPD